MMKTEEKEEKKNNKKNDFRNRTRKDLKQEDPAKTAE